MTRAIAGCSAFANAKVTHLPVSERKPPRSGCSPGVSWAVLTLCVELGLRAPQCDGLGFSFYRW